MLIEDKGNQYLVTNKMTIAQMLKNGGIEILDHIIDYAKDALIDELTKDKKPNKKKK